MNLSSYILDEPSFVFDNFVNTLQSLLPASSFDVELNNMYPQIVNWEANKSYGAP